ncbi:MAG TPA: hypothetical protein V6D35_17345 [Candidatus Sericytochromatia bacterium]
MQHPKWQQRRAKLPLEPEYVRHNAIACIVQVCFGRSHPPYQRQPKQHKFPETSIR